MDVVTQTDVVVDGAQVVHIEISSENDQYSAGKQLLEPRVAPTGCGICGICGFHPARRATLGPCWVAVRAAEALAPCGELGKGWSNQGAVAPRLPLLTPSFYGPKWAASSRAGRMCAF